MAGRFRRLGLLCLFFAFSFCKEQKAQTNEEVRGGTPKTVTTESSNAQELFGSLRMLELPFSSNDIAKYIYEKEALFYLNTDDLSQSVMDGVSFNQTKCSTQLSNWFYNVSDKKIFPIGKIVADYGFIIVSLVSYYSENDASGVFLQLNTFDIIGKQVDYLIVYNRFRNETLYKWDFKIDPYLQIRVSEVEENYIEYDESGDIIGELEEPDINETINTYTTDSKGCFLIH